MGCFMSFSWLERDVLNHKGRANVQRIDPNKWPRSEACKTCVLTRVDQNDGMIPRKHSNALLAAWAIKNSRTYQHVGVWPNMLGSSSFFFTNRIPAQLGPKNQRFDLRAEAFYGPWRLQDADQCPATLGKLSPSRVFRLKSYLKVMSCILSKSSPKVKLRRLLGKFTPSKVLSK